MLCMLCMLCMLLLAILMEAGMSMHALKSVACMADILRPDCSL